jgi:hypothetical protein
MIYNESQLHASLDTHLFKYMRQYLRITFEKFGDQTKALKATPVSIRDGGFLKTVKTKKPDFGVYRESVRGVFTTLLRE